MNDSMPLLSSADCPAHAELLAFHRGELPLAALDCIANHLESCPACDARVRQFDTEVEPMLAALRLAPPAFEAAKPFDAALFAATHGVGQAKEAPADLSAPVPGYDVLEQIGQGGMGVVHKARHRKLKRMVALKRLKVGGDWNIGQFRREAEAVARLQHPNIVQIYEIGEHNQQPFLALELVEGRPLDRYLEGRPLPARASAELVATLARAVHYAHQQGVVHRDLKPANILLAGGREPVSRGRGGSSNTAQLIASGLLSTPKITDFGIAKRLDSESRSSSDGTIIGTPSYMSPEQASGETEAIGPTTDVYALGAILYECLAGRPPFEGESSYETMRQVVHEDPVPPSRLQSRLPRDLETIALKCLHKDPAKRYATAADLADDLGRYLRHEPIQARPTPLWERLWKARQRRPREAALAATVVVCIVIGMALVTVLWRQAVSAGRNAVERAAAEHAARQLAQRREARLAFDQGMGFADQGDAARALLWLSRALERAEDAGAADLEGPIRVNLAETAQMLSRPMRTIHHGAAVRAATYSPDGRWIASVGNDCLARIWNARTGVLHGAPLLQGRGAPGLTPAIAGPLIGQAAVSVAFSPDSAKLLVGGSDAKARYWDVASGKLLHTLTHSVQGNSVVSDVAVSPTGSRLLTAHDDGIVKLWDAFSGKLLVTLPRPASPPHCAAFTPDGRHVLSSGRSDPICLWDAATGEPRAQLPALPELIHRMVVSPDGHWALTGGERAAQLWDLTSLRPQGMALPHADRVEAAAFSPDSRCCATGDHAGYVRLWSVATRQPVGPVIRHDDQVRALAFSPDGRQLLVGGLDGSLRIWEVPASAAIEPALSYRRPIVTVAFNADGQRLFVASEDSIALIPLSRSGSEPSVRFRAPVERLQSAALSPDGRRVATSDWVNGSTILSDAQTGQAMSAPLLHSDRVHRLVYSPDGTGLIALGNEHRLNANGLYCWDLAGPAPVRREWPEPVPQPECAVFQTGGRLLLIGSADGTARFWDWPAGRADGAPLTHSEPVTAVAFSHDGKTAATGCRDGTIRLWDVAERRPLRAAFGPSDRVVALAFSPDGTYLLAGGADRRARFWDVATGLPVGRPLRHEDLVTGVAFHPNGMSVATSGRDAVVQRWRAPLTPVSVTAERLKRWVETLTGRELDGHGNVLMLDDETRGQRSERLAQLGGPPMP